MASRVASLSNIDMQEIKCTEEKFIHAVPLLSFDSQTLFAPSPPLLHISEQTLSAAVNAAIKYRTIITD